VHPGHRSNHHHQLGDSPVLVAGQEIGAVELPIADARKALDLAEATPVSR